MTAPVRKTVKPAHAGASIPDPAHGMVLPQSGAEVVWDHYWIGRLSRGEIVEVKPALEAAKPIASATTAAVKPVA